MEDFKKRSLTKKNIPVDDDGIELKKLLELIKDNDYYAQIINLLEIDDTSDDFIDIKGASTLVAIMKGIKNKYYKVDFVSNFENISVYNNDEFTINFEEIENNEYLEDLKLNRLVTVPIYSAKKDFFIGLYQMDRYASSLIKNGHKSIVKENLELLKKVKNNIRKYRLLHDKQDNSFYLRTIISTGNYFNYDNNVAVVLGLLTLHRESISTGNTYELNLCEFNESYIKMFFESSEIKELSKIGNVKNIIAVSNDEIKREALKFLGICSIIFKHKDNNENELFIQPKDIKSKILTIKHSQKPKNALLELTNIINTESIHKELYQDIQKITNIKSPDQIKFLVKSKVEKATRDELKHSKELIIMELNKKVETVIELLELFNKINLIVSEDISAKEYLRYIQYKALIERK
ncbi:MAG: hypothetical protein GQ564_13130 [Bacteroidales bacterium]|nr:hypothetical protein [Bacteroidales bacterium]